MTVFLSGIGRVLQRLGSFHVVFCWEDFFIFNPLTTESPDTMAELANKLSLPVIEAFKAGLISREDAVAELKARGEPYACWTMI